ncbi:hypothetical protein HK097_005753 [Rhizophlyctis rosea]|uniref:Uncharacterized protein n=1 Tax=Rhizophlyctis rosea TaxID=64517 RepID=A0AAD5X611_9FUNG|nr:hypothetical protein HK097_005753 [Rhizophlyctis rosea]
MKGDLAMLDKATRVWFDRFLPDPTSPPEDAFDNDYYQQLRYQINGVALNQVLPLPVDEWELSAVDFHCSDILDHLRYKLDDEDRNIPEEQLRKIMWEKRSSVSTKRPMWGEQDTLDKGRLRKVSARDEAEMFWSKCSSSIDTIAKRILRRMWKAETATQRVGD